MLLLTDGKKGDEMTEDELEAFHQYLHEHPLNHDMDEGMASMFDGILNGI